LIVKPTGEGSVLKEGLLLVTGGKKGGGGEEKCGEKKITIKPPP